MIAFRLLAALRWVLFPALCGLVVFGSAGRIDLPMVWALLAALSAFLVAITLLADPGLVRERERPGPGSQDRLTQTVSTLLLVAHWALAGLDVGRLDLAPVPFPLQVAGLVGYALCLAVLLRAVTLNRFYSSVVRLQPDRGHEPISGGPYRVVRHPGYTATMLGAVFGSLALGSWLALVPIVPFLALFVRRTLIEDRMLRRDLPGYEAYAQRVRYRLLVGVF